MAEPQQPMPTRGGNWWKILVSIAAVLLVFLAAVLVGISYFSGANRVEQACADAKLTLLNPEKSKALSSTERKNLESSISELCK
jgi:hypothetical protein